jgi:hypothetical protein
LRARYDEDVSGPSEEVVIDVPLSPARAVRWLAAAIVANQIEEAYTGVYSVDGADDCS